MNPECEFLFCGQKCRKKVTYFILFQPVTSVVKNVERQRFRKQGAGSGGRAAGNYYFEGGGGPRLTYDRRSQTLSHGSYAGK